MVPLRICPESTMRAPSSAVAVLSFFPLDKALMASTTSKPDTTWPAGGSNQGQGEGCGETRCQRGRLFVVWKFKPAEETRGHPPKMV